jgi:ERCC4-type nuclease
MGGLVIQVSSAVGSKELYPLIKNQGIQAELTVLPYGDAGFEGRGPEGSVYIGIERKALHDMLACIDDARYSGHQRIGMKAMYDISVLMIEGHWKPHSENGMLMEGYTGGMNYGYCRPGGRRVMYNKLYRYLISVALSGVIVCYSRDLGHTAFNICEWWHYFQKPWEGHTSLLEMQKIAIPTLNYKPPLVRKWASDIEGVGVKLSEQAERIFRKPITLANADESEWLRIPGIGIKSAQAIVKEIWGEKKW